VKTLDINKDKVKEEISWHVLSESIYLKIKELKLA